MNYFSSEKTFWWWRWYFFPPIVPLYMYSIFDTDNFPAVFLEKLEIIQKDNRNAKVYQKKSGINPTKLFYL